MRYVMQEKIWAMGDDFIIKDENENDVFQVDGKAFSFGDKLAFLDREGNELAYISQVVFSFKKRYEIYRDGNLFAEVVKDFTFFKDQYTVDIPGPNDYIVEGDFWDHEYTFLRGDRPVAQVSKKYFSWSHTYGVDVADGEDAVTILATAVVIDMVKHDEEQSHGH